MSSSRRVAALVATALLSLAAPAAASAVTGGVPPEPPSQVGRAERSVAATGYTYWGYFTWNQSKSTWDYMTVGANDREDLPQDGEVYGFRWALVVKDPRLPRAEPDFEAICSESGQPAEGEKRVAIVVDYGSDADAPEGATPPQARGICAVVDDGFTVQQALSSETDVRTGNGGLICGIDGYPAEGCGDVIKDAEEGPADQPVALALPSDEAGADDTGAEPAADGATDESADVSADDSGDGVPWGLVVTGAVVVVLAVGALTLRKR